ncbi:hypothetical protein PR003_g15382 [Phytophthora rubi]|uniref:Uncharacterized protein n=1 Tax=Phytophthora rubi TaxID=129364 RepID=A0A6A4EQL6_9STRA|nr:hypothetical protein PR003_g15382 [Phytophthora rubi]
MFCLLQPPYSRLVRSCKGPSWAQRRPRPSWTWRRRRPELDPEETRVDPDLVGAAVELNSEETAVELGLMLSGAELCLEEDMGLLDERGGRLVMVL